MECKAFSFVGMGRFELPAPRPPDEYSNLAELHPGDGCEVWVWWRGECLGVCEMRGENTHFSFNNKSHGVLILA